tara:strand:- start:48 stop:647 length:600 start_codon:yes stop_codon:yes gene_type:complete
MESKFSNIYSKNIWGGSGSGSNFSHANKFFLKELRTIIDDNNIKTIADSGCGDFLVMKHFEFNSDEKYEGLDCVDFLIDSHNQNYSNDNIGFICQDISVDVPSGYDLVILKDVIQHWDDDIIMDKFLKILQKNKYVYCINGYKFCRDPTKNNWTNRVLDKKYSYHPLDFNKEPFTQFLPYVVDSKKRGAKEYILFSSTI